MRLSTRRCEGVTKAPAELWACGAWGGPCVRASGGSWEAEPSSLGSLRSTHAFAAPPMAECWRKATAGASGQSRAGKAERHAWWSE